MRPHQRFAINIFFQNAFTQHQAQRFAGAPPWGICRLVNNMPQIVKPAGLRRLAGLLPCLA